MVTKGIITSIDFNGNTCQVRIPFFETAGNDPITGTAIVSNTPGSYNGYKVGDVVLVAFEDGKMHNPVIIGKLYLGVAKEKQDPRGTINVETTTASKSASLPADAVLTANVDSNVPNTNAPFGSLASIANNLNSLNTDVNQLDKFTRNQFNSVITDVNKQGEQLRSEIKQTADSIEANVVHKHQDGSQDALGWDLTTDSWQINAKDTVNGEVKDINIVTIDRSGMSIAGDLKLNGYPKNIVVRYAQNDSDTDYPNLYNFKPDSFPGTEIDKTWYYNKYIKIIETDKEKYILISSENIDDYTIIPGETVAYVYNLEEINTEWKTETPARVDGKYIWQWTHTEIYSFDGDKWTEQDDDKVVCITGAKGETGTPGTTGRSVLSVTKFYKRATSKPNPPDVKDPTDWYTAPPAFVKGNNYYESDRTIYDSVDSAGKDYSWSGVIENSMLTVDFINSLGISAQGLRVVDEHENLILSANIAGETANKVKIGGFSLSTNEFKTTRPEGTGDNSWDAADVLITNADQTYISKVANQGRNDWRLLVGTYFGVNSEGRLYCANADVTGNIIATSGRLENIALIKSGYLDSNQIESDNINTKNLKVANEASIAGFKLKSATTESATTASKEVSLQIITPTNNYVDSIGSYIGGGWLFTLTFACYYDGAQQSFISQHNFTNYQISYATFESNETKKVGTGSDTSTTNYLTKIYFNNTSLTAYKGQSTITATVSGGGGGASPSSKWKLKEVAIYVNGNLKTLSYFNGGSDSAKVTIDYLTTVNKSNLLLDGGISINGDLIPYKDDCSIGDLSHKWNTLYVNNAYATAFYASSDKRLKKNIKEFEPKNSILNLPVVEFDFKDSNIHQIGCIAQDLQKICPELVTTNADGYLSISENKLSYLLLLELKKLNNRVTELEQKLIEKDMNK